MERIVITGSREWADRVVIHDALATLAPGSTVVVGGARGADTIAEQEAYALGFKVVRMPADWKTHGRVAGFIRNQAMLDTRPDRVFAFQVGRSRGTQDTIDRAQHAGYQTIIFRQGRGPEQ
jgi:hypothetical protein